MARVLEHPLRLRLHVQRRGPGHRPGRGIVNGDFVAKVIAEESVGWIDLLKVDVQKSEYDVLAGIAEQDWKKIGQIVLEVHDLNGRLTQITSLLGTRGFQVIVEQDEMLRGSVLYNLYAIRK